MEITNPLTAMGIAIINHWTFTHRRRPSKDRRQGFFTRTELAGVVFSPTRDVADGTRSMEVGSSRRFVRLDGVLSRPRGIRQVLLTSVGNATLMRTIYCSVAYTASKILACLNRCRTLYLAALRRSPLPSRIGMPHLGIYRNTRPTSCLATPLVLLSVSPSPGEL